jgi:hypothetical protein
MACVVQLRALRACGHRGRVRRPVTRSLALPAHELGAEGALGGVLIVRTAAEPDPGHGGQSAVSNCLNMIKLEPGP